MIIKTSTKACARMGKDTADYDPDVVAIDEDKATMQWEYRTDWGTEFIEMSKITPPDGEDAPVPGAFISKDYKAVKYCNTEGFWNDHFVSDSTHESIPIINIELSMPDVDNNFCYEGSHTWKNVMYGVVILLEIGLTMGTGPVGMAVVGTAGVFATTAIEDAKMWPNHN